MMVGPVKIQDSRGSMIPDPQVLKGEVKPTETLQYKAEYTRSGPRVEKEVQSDCVTREDVKEREFSMLGFQ